MKSKPNFSKEMSELFKKDSFRVIKVPEKDTKLYNVHKRSTNGRLDVPVMWGLEEKDTIADPIFKTRTVYNRSLGIKECVFYEKVRQDGYMSGLYDNEKPLLTKEEK